MNKKPSYRLIKTYPGSEPLGTIFKRYDGWNSYGCETTDGNIQYSTVWTPEYFESGIGEYYEVVGGAKHN